MNPFLRLFILALVFVGPLSGCSTLLYFPTREQHYDPNRAGLRWEDVEFKSQDGTRLGGWYFHHKDPKLKTPKATLVFFHGNGENRTSHFTTLVWLLDEGYDFFIFDYRGYGNSEGTPDPKGTVEDGMAAIRWAHQNKLNHKTPDVPLVVFAQSLGGAVALRSLIELKKEVPIAWIVVDSSFQSYQWAGMSVLSQSIVGSLFQPFSFLALSDEWAPGDRIKELAPTPILIMHGDQDQMIHYRLGERLFITAGEPKEFLRIEGGYHTDAFWRHQGKYKKIFLEKLSAIVNR